MTDTKLEIHMLPRRIEDCDFTYWVDAIAKIGEMPCKRDLVARQTTTFWIPEQEIPEERPDDFSIHIVVTNGYDPIIEVGFGSSLDDVEFEQRETFDYLHEPRQKWCGVLVTDVVRDYLNTDDGFFALRVGMTPPPPVAIWMS